MMRMVFQTDRLISARFACLSLTSMLILLASGCGQSLADIEAKDQVYLKQFTARAPVASTLNESTRREFEFFTMLVPNEWKTNHAVAKLNKDCVISVRVDPDPFHELSSSTEQMIEAVKKLGTETSRACTTVAGREGFEITIEHPDKLTGKKVMHKFYTTTLAHDEPSKIMNVIYAEAIISLDTIDLEGVADEMVSSIRSTL